MDTFEEARGQERFGCDDVDPGQLRELREQREVHRPQPVGIGDAIGHRDHDVL